MAGEADIMRAPLMQPIRDALDVYLAANAECPYKQPGRVVFNLPSSQPCSKCGAKASDGCHKQHTAAIAFASAVNDIVNKGSEEVGG